MSQPIYLDPRQVPASLRGGYSGTKFKAVVGEHVTIPADAGLWDGGSRDSYSAVRLADGAGVPFPGQQSAPWDGSRVDRPVTLQPGIVVVRHTMFCGKDMGLTFHLHPVDAAPMLPAPAAEMTEAERHALDSRGFKSSYAGKDRYRLQRERVNPCWAPAAERKPFPTREEWNAAEQSLIARGYLNKAGAITPAGRNARGSI